MFRVLVDTKFVFLLYLFKKNTEQTLLSNKGLNLNSEEDVFWLRHQHGKNWEFEEMTYDFIICYL